jgi:hypothetical protein
MSSQTVTRAIECNAAPQLIYAKLADAFLIPQWAPVFADTVEHVQGASFRVTKGNDRFNVDVVLNESSLTVDYLREMTGGKRGGAYIRVIPRPVGGSAITMTVPVGQGSTPTQVSAVLEEELEALIKLV